MKKRLLTFGLALTAIFAINGCGGSSNGSNPSSTTVGGNQSPQTAYLSYSPSRFINDQLWKTDGTPANTSLVSNAMSESNIVQDQYLLIQEVYKVGNSIFTWANYMDDTGSGFFATGYNKLYKTDIANSSTSVVSGVYRPYTAVLWGIGGIKHFTASNGNTYIFNRPIANTGGTQLFKLSSNGTITAIAQPSGGYLNTSFNAYFQDGDTLYSVALDKKLYSIDLSSSNPTWSSVSGFGNTITTNLGLYITNNNICTLDGSTNPGTFKCGVITGSSLDHTISGIDGYGWILSNTINLPYFVDGTNIYAALYNSTANTKGLYKIDTVNYTGTFLGGSYNNMGDAKSIFSFNGDVYYLGSIGGINSLYKYSNNTTTLVATFPAYVDPQAQSENSVYKANGKLYFAKSDTQHGLELWSYDGTTLHRETDINPGNGDSRPTRVTALNGKIVFQATPDGANNKLYSLDGTTLTPLN